MKISKNNLISVVRKIIAESRKNLREQDSVTLGNGEVTSFGSLEHLQDLESSLLSMKRMRDAQRRGTASRMAYSQAVKQLQRQLKSAQRHYEKNNS